MSAEREDLMEILHRTATADRVKNDALSRTPVVKAKIERVKDLATYLDTLADGDKHYAALIRAAITGEGEA